MLSILASIFVRVVAGVLTALILSFMFRCQRQAGVITASY